MSVTEMKEARHKIVGQMTSALAYNKMKRFDRLNDKYQMLSDRIEKENKCLSHR